MFESLEIETLALPNEKARSGPAKRKRAGKATTAVSVARPATRSEDLDQHVHQELRRLPRLERGALQVLWTELFGNSPNPKLRREVMVLILTYRIQEKAYGGLKPATRKRLLTYAEDFSKDKEVLPKQVRATKPGTRIVREWGSRLHEVVVVDGGFEYDGRRYRSLSEIAREITGTRWSGPAFFGLKKRSAGAAA